MTVVKTNAQISKRSKNWHTTYVHYLTCCQETRSSVLMGVTHGGWQKLRQLTCHTPVRMSLLLSREHGMYTTVLMCCGGEGSTSTPGEDG